MKKPLRAMVKNNPRMRFKMSLTKPTISPQKRKKPTNKKTKRNVVKAKRMKWRTVRRFICAVRSTSVTHFTKSLPFTPTSSKSTSRQSSSVTSK